MSKGNFRKQVYKVYNENVLIEKAKVNEFENWIGDSLFRLRAGALKDFRFADYWICDKRKLK